MTREELLAEVKESFDEMVAVRRHLHQNPELSFKEYQTTEYIISQLREAGINEISRPAKTGVVARIRGGSPGITAAFRADIDALPIREDNDLPFCSVHDGVMHACGHDGHTAIQLAAARILNRHREELKGDVLLIFQHAEEVPPGGGIEMKEAGVMEGVDLLFGLHLSSSYPTGCFGVKSGVLTSATDCFEIDIVGKGGHSSMPEATVDPVVLGAEVILSLQTVVSRRIRALEPLVLSVCQVNAGDAYNIIPEEFHIRGSLRTFSEETREKVPRMMEEICDGITRSAGAGYRFRFEKGYASVVNDTALAKETEDLLISLYGEDCIVHIDPLMPGEDFSALQGTCPAFFVEVGTGNPAKDTCYPHHNPHYRMDEDGMLYGAGYLVSCAMSHLGALQDGRQRT